MFREMRRKKQLLPQKEADKILNSCTSGVLSLSGDDGYSYGVPLSYVYEGSKIYFHCAKSGHKLDSIKRNPKVSFCVIAQDRASPEEYTTYYKSVIVFGKIRVLEAPAEIDRALRLLSEKYNPTDTPENLQNAIDSGMPSLCMLELEAEHITAKAAKEIIMNK